MRVILGGLEHQITKLEKGRYEARLAWIACKLDLDTVTFPFEAYNQHQSIYSVSLPAKKQRRQNKAPCSNHFHRGYLVRD